MLDREENERVRDGEAKGRGGGRWMIMGGDGFQPPGVGGRQRLGA